MSINDKDVAKITKACSNEEVVKAAKFHIKPLNGLDILVCGGCLQVFHLLADLQKHKQSGICCKPEADPTKFNPTADIWAFMLWKNSPDTKKTKTTNFGAGVNAAMWKKWLEIPAIKRRAWLVAGNILYDMNMIHKSKDLEENPVEFDTIFPERIAELNSTLESQEDRAEMALDKVSIKTESPRVKKVKKQTASEIAQENAKTLVHSILDKKYDTKSKKFLYHVRWESHPKDFFTWEYEESLEKWSDVLVQFEIQYSSTERPCRSSKAKAIDKVKQWTIKSKADDESADIKYEDEEEEEEEESADLSRSDDEDFVPEDPLGSPEREEGSSNESAYNEDDMEDEDLGTKRLSARGTKRKSVQKPAAKKAKTIVPVKKPEPVDKIFHLSNIHGMVRVNAKTLPKLKSGIFVGNSNPSLVMLSSVLCKQKLPVEQPGLVIITNDVNINKSGIQRRQGFRIQDESQKASVTQDPDVDSDAVQQKSSTIKLTASNDSPKCKSINVPAQINKTSTQKSIQDVITNRVAGNATLVSTPINSQNSSKIVGTNSVVSTKPVIKTPLTISGDIQSGPQHVEIPQGVDPGSVEVPTGMQLMVSEAGEYYLLPQQPEGSTVALAQDPESGTVQVVAIPENRVVSQSIVTGDMDESQPESEALAVPQEGDAILNTGIAEQGSGLLLVVKQNGELMLVPSDQLQNAINGGAVQIA